jgi:hypothetical protein
MSSAGSGAPGRRRDSRLDAVAQREVLRARRGADRVGLHEAQSGDGRGSVVGANRLRATAWRRRSGDPQASAGALQAVRLAAAQKWQRMLVNFPHWASQIAQAGLDAGVEVEFLTAMVRSRRLQRPDPHRADWPWRLRVWALGPSRWTVTACPWRPAW